MTVKRVESKSKRWTVLALLGGTGFLGFMLSLLLLGRVPLVTIPALIGFPFETAKLRLENLGLRIEITRMASSLSDEPDTVLEMDPPPGNEVRKNRVIHLLVAEEAELGHIPRVVGLQRAKVAERLAKAGLKIGIETGLSWPDIEADIVFAQDPRPETTPTQDRHVNLLVSQGPPPRKYRMPSLLYGQVEPVLDAIAEAGLRAKIIPVITEAYDSDLIIGQIPLAGYPILEGEELILEVSQSRDSNQEFPPRLESLTFQVPSGDIPVSVKITVNDVDGERILFEQLENPGELIQHWIRVRGNATIKIIFPSGLIWERNLVP